MMSDDVIQGCDEHMFCITFLLSWPPSKNHVWPHNLTQIFERPHIFLCGLFMLLTGEICEQKNGEEYAGKAEERKKV